MKTKRIDFDIDLAKKIQAGEAQGRIVTRDGKPVRVICWDRIDEHYPIVALLYENDKEENVEIYTTEGMQYITDGFYYSIHLEVPYDTTDDTPQFKPFDKVLVRDEEYEEWKCGIYSHYIEDDEEFPYQCAGNHYRYCIPYEGNEHLVGTTDEPKGGAQ